LAIEGNEKTYFEAVLLEDGKVELIQIERAKLKSTIDYAIGNRIFEKVDAETHEGSVLDNDNKLDMTNGIPAPLNEANFTMNEAELIFFTNKTNDQNFELFINGKKKCSFMPNSYYSMRLTSQAIPINVCLKSDSDEYCEAISVDIFNTRYFEVIINKKGKVSLFEKKSASMHSSINYLIEKGKMVKIEEETK